jgi:hypothetical protein
MITWTKVRDAIEAFLSGPLWDFLKPTVAILETDGGNILISAAESAVVVGFGAGGGAAGMAAALTSFKAEVVAKELPFIESQARALIELALQKAKVAVSQPVGTAAVAGSGAAA